MPYNCIRRDEVAYPQKMSTPIVSSPPSVAQQLYRRLLESLKEAYRPGDQFPSEREVARRFGVSRPTAARALGRLLDEGLLENQRGAGRYVRQVPLNYELGSLMSFDARVRAMGMQPSTEVLDFHRPGEGPLPSLALRELQLLPGEGVYSFFRRRFANGKPVILERIWLAARFCPSLEKSDLAGSMLRLLDQRYGLVPTGSRQVMRAVILNDPDVALFWEDEVGAAFEVESTGYLEGGVPLWWEQSLCLGSAYEYHNRLGPLCSSRPAVGVLRIPPKLG